MKFFMGLFSEAGGNPSSMRFLATLVVAGMVGTWVEVSVKKQELQPVSTEMVMMVASALGIKAWQRGKEEGGNSKLQTPNSKETSSIKLQE